MVSPIRAFTVLEVLVAMAVLALLLGVLLSAVNQAATITRRASDKVSSFQAARAAFDLMTRNLSQATLNSYWDYDDPLDPKDYRRQSELHFLIESAGGSFPGTAGTGQAMFFQLPSGITTTTAYTQLENLLSACGYFIDYGPVDELPAPFPSKTPVYRYQLMQAIEPSELLKVYESRTGSDWVAGLAASAVPIAENVIGLIAWPRQAPADDPGGSGLSSDFHYDSRQGAGDTPQSGTAHQLPPVVQLTVIALGETSAARICTAATPPAEIASALAGLFTSSNQPRFEADLVTLESRLAGLNFRVFTAMVPMRASKMQ